jgi:hypothetical protein
MGIAMNFSHFLRLLQRFGGEFWLPLPLIAALLWVTGNFIVAQVLSRPYTSDNKLQVESPSDLKFSIPILAINAEIDRNRGRTTILITSTDLTLSKKKYEFAMTQASQVEAAIAQKLGMPIDAVKRLISYQIKD